MKSFICAFAASLALIGTTQTAVAADAGVNGSRHRATKQSAAGSQALAPSSSSKPKSSGVAATIRTDGAMIYAKPDFDSDVLVTLKQNEKVRVSDGTVGDYAKFHKVRAGVVLGYIADIDVQLDGAPKKRDHKRGVGQKLAKKGDAKGKDGHAKKEKFKDENLPILFTRYVGLLIGTSQFQESISGVDANDNLLIYGLKITGPDVLFNGPIMDVNIAFHYGAPSYYSSLSSTKPSGFIVMADTLLLLPVFNRDTMMGYFGVGPMIKFSNFGVTSAGDPKSLTQLDFGLDLGGGVAFKIYKFALRFEGKYMIEKRTERLFQVALQQQF